jgi:GNAT superfamily N-acetyltransferase
MILFHKTLPSSAVLRSVWVEPDYRRRGVGGILLQKGTSALAKLGTQRIESIHRSTLEEKTAFEALLARAAWSQPRLRMMVLESTYEGMLRSPVMANPAPLDPRFTLVPWHEVETQEIERLAVGRHFHVEVWPPNYGPDFHRETSLGVMFGGELVGWVVNHAKAPGILRFTTSWLREDLQGRGTFAAVIAESYHRTAGTGYDHGIWTVPAIFPRMVAFARRRLAPYCYRVSETLGSEWTNGDSD